MAREYKWLIATSAVICIVVLPLLTGIGQEQATNEAPTGFDDATNGMVDQATHDADRTKFFEEVENQTNGLGPTFNQTSCVSCHSNPKAGGNSTTVEQRAGHLDASGNFQNPSVVINAGKNVIPDRSLINNFAICPQAQERTPDTETIRASRAANDLFGEGFVEAVPDETLQTIARMQAVETGGAVHGEAIEVPVLESPGTTRVGRFGWKDQHGSLLSFAGDAYINEMGITNRLITEDFTEVCDSPEQHDPEDTTGPDGLNDIDHFARFVRADKAPPRDTAVASQPDAQAGSRVFEAVGCNLCHVTAMKTAPAGTAINGGNFTIPDALGNKVFHPFSDFLLHDVGTGDGIVQNGPPDTAHKLRTAPLWGLHARQRFMHDLGSSSYSDAIQRHRGEATMVINRFNQLKEDQKNQLYKFLSSL
jgi:CxxC motif-containing protein (DUF1111 family)